VSSSDFSGLTGFSLEINDLRMHPMGREKAQNSQRGKPQPNIRLERERLAKRTQKGRKMEAKI
jgi:hypothetical protein